jgi:hypothetical protein
MSYFGSLKPKIEIHTDEDTIVKVDKYGDYTKYALGNHVVKFSDGYMIAVISIDIFPTFLQEYHEKQQMKYLKIYIEATGGISDILNEDDQLKALNLMSKLRYEMGEKYERSSGTQS